MSVLYTVRIWCPLLRPQVKPYLNWVVVLLGVLKFKITSPFGYSLFDKEHNVV